MCRNHVTNFPFEVEQSSWKVIMTFSRKKKKLEGGLLGVFLCMGRYLGELISSSLWSGVTSCSNIIIKNAEIKFDHGTRKISGMTTKFDSQPIGDWA